MKYLLTITDNEGNFIELYFPNRDTANDIKELLMFAENVDDDNTHISYADQYK